VPLPLRLSHGIARTSVGLGMGFLASSCDMSSFICTAGVARRLLRRKRTAIVLLAACSGAWCVRPTILQAQER